MKKSKSLFSQLYKKAIFYGLVDKGGWFPQMLASRKTSAEYTKLAKISALLAFLAVIKITMSICVNLCSLWLKIFQSKITNYAKRTQF